MIRSIGELRFLFQPFLFGILSCQIFCTFVTLQKFLISNIHPDLLYYKKIGRCSHPAMEMLLSFALQLCLNVVNFGGS